MSAPDWTYQAPRIEASDQCYYRHDASNSRRLTIDLEASADFSVFRFVDDVAARVKLSRGFDCQMAVWLTPEEIVILRDALSDALRDIETLEATRQAKTDRAVTFELIQNLLDDAAGRGDPQPHPIHPDVHYVPAGEVANKVAELEASGCARYLVLAEPAPGKFGA